MSKDSNRKIVSKKLVITEGRDAELFLVWACREYREERDFQVMDFGGNHELSVFLEVLKNLEGFDKVETIVIARDAEDDATAALESVQSSIRKVGLPCPQTAFNFESDEHKKVAIMFFPGPCIAEGALEDLCLMTVEDNDTMNCVDSFLDCIESNGIDLPRKHKNKLHSYLSSTSNYVGMKIGEASHAKAWNPSHLNLQPFKQIIINL